jgi:predicted nucleic acid-binding protein
VSGANVVDSAGWLEYFADTGRAEFYAAAIEDTENLIVPTISVFEVFRKVLRQRGENEALQAAVAMQTGTLIDLDVSLALSAARLPLPLADSIIYQTALQHRATLWTQDEHLRDMPGVRFLKAS